MLCTITRGRIVAIVIKWQGKYPKLVDWVEGKIAETLTFHRLPRAHHKHLKSTNMLERLNQEIKRRTKASLIYRRTKNLRAVQLLLGHTKIESTVRYIRIEVDDALEMAEQTEE